MQKILNKLHFGHSLLAGGVITLMSTVALVMGHIDGLTLFRLVGTVVGMLVLSILFARFE